MKEKEIRELFDNLDCEETENLLAGIDATGFTAGESEKKLDYSRIEKMVFEKTGLNTQSGKVHETDILQETKDDENDSSQSKIIRWKKYSSFAAVACFGFMLGILTMFAGSFFTDNPDKKPGKEQVAESETQEPPKEDDDDEYGVGNTESESEESEGEKDSDKDDDKKDDKKHKDNKKDNKDKKPDLGEIKTGNDDDEYTSMPSDDVDKLIENSTSEIDMESFILKYKDVDAMLEDSDCVIRGVKEESILRETEESGVYELVAEFRVDSVLVDNLGDIKDTIRVNEGIRYYAEEEKIVHIGGYDNMVCGNEYILFLKKTSTKRYRIAGLIYGKVPVDESEDAIEIDSSYLENKYVVEIKNIISAARDMFVNMGNPEEDSDSEKPKDDDAVETDATVEPSATPTAPVSATASPMQRIIEEPLQE